MVIRYQITPLPQKHIYKVRLTFEPNQTAHIIKLPVWIPGSYMVREFSKQISLIQITQKSDTANISQISKNSWQLTGLTVGENTEINYEVYAYEYGIRTAFLDNFRGYFNPTSLCLAVVGYENYPHTIIFSDLPPTWGIACGLRQTEPKVFGAENYDHLLDCPFELGVFTTFEFVVRGITHYLILSGIIPPFNQERLLDDIGKICEYQINLFGGKVPYTNYTFILNLSGEIYTGLEHRNSTLLLAPYYSLPNLMGSNDEDYHKLLGLISHEFFHVWNIKQIKPKLFIPYNLDQEIYTKLLWWFEGVTSYYDDLVLYRVGLISRDKYLGLIVDNLNNVYRFAGVTRQSVANSSLTAWIKYYRQDENSPNNVVSYYVKGALIAMCLDLLLRQQSKASLDDVMRYLYQEWCKDQAGIGEDEIPALIKAATGVNLADFIYQATETTDMLPVMELFAKYGLNLLKRQPENYQEKGKFYVTLPQEAVAANINVDLGVKLEKGLFGYVVKNVYAGTNAEAAGIAAGDIILVINNIKLINVDKQLKFFEANQKAELAILRQDRLLYVPIILQPPQIEIYDMVLADEELLSAWL